MATEQSAGGLVLWEMYGFPAARVGNVSWLTTVTLVPVFLQRTGLTYCELVELQGSGYLPFTVTTAASSHDATQAGGSLPGCEPCCLEDLRLVLPGSTDENDQGQLADLYRLIVFIRLWRRLRERAWCELTFAELAQVSTALGLFGSEPTETAVNPDFLRQLAALLMLRDDFGTDPAGLLALWAVPPAAGWAQAVQLLLHGVGRHARSRWSCAERGPSSPRSSPRTSIRCPGWPGSTRTPRRHLACAAHPYAAFRRGARQDLRLRLHRGEILFLFSTLDHLDGDDPFPLRTRTSPPTTRWAAQADPAGDGPHSLWSLRRELLAVELDAEPRGSGAGPGSPRR